MPRLKPNPYHNTPEEDAAITAAAMSDPDNPIYTDGEWEQIKPRVRISRPGAAITKKSVTIRLSRDVLERFEASGAGWQTRIDAALKDWLKSHTPAGRGSGGRRRGAAAVK